MAKKLVKKIHGPRIYRSRAKQLNKLFELIDSVQPAAAEFIVVGRKIKNNSNFQPV